MGEREDFLIRQIEKIHRQARDEAQPFVDELVRIRSLKGPPPLILRADEVSLSDSFAALGRLLDKEPFQ